MELPKIASFWMGERLSFLEQLCLKSFERLGHEVTLYSYTGVKNAPVGIKLGDARLILPEKEFLNFVGKPHPAAAVFSDKFRVHILLQTDAIWVDCDMFALKPFEDLPYIMPLEYSYQMSNAVLKMPKNSQALHEYAEFLESNYPKFPDHWTYHQEALAETQRANQKNLHILDLKFYHWGPFALTYFTKKSGEFRQGLPGKLFFPIAGHLTQRMLRPPEKFRTELHESSWAIHFYSSMVKPKLKNRHPDGNIPQNSFLFEQCQLHGIDPKQSPF